jgi:transforming growth factor-beta-induced protein
MKSIFNIKSLTLVCLLLGLIFIQAGCENKADAGQRPRKMDIVDTAASADNFSTLVTAIKAADLVETLKGDGPFTVFAPTDEAFAKLPEGTLEDLLKPENKEKLASILTYHVVSGKVTAAEVVKLKSAKTVNGKDVHIRVKHGDVMINSSKVIKTDIDCSNGIIHVIDTVLLP